MKFGKLVDKAWEDKTAAEILAAPPSALDVLTEKHDEILQGLGITTIADLGKQSTRSAPRPSSSSARSTSRPPRRPAWGGRSGRAGCRTLGALGAWRHGASLGV